MDRDCPSIPPGHLSLPWEETKCLIIQGITMTQKFLLNYLSLEDVITDLFFFFKSYTKNKSLNLNHFYFSLYLCQVIWKIGIQYRLPNLIITVMLSKSYPFEFHFMNEETNVYLKLCDLFKLKLQSLGGPFTLTELTRSLLEKCILNLESISC